MKKKYTKKRKNRKDLHPLLDFLGQQGIGGKAADMLTAFMGSWTFIFLFMLFLLAWITVNMLAWVYLWDPYPFILLNLFLSCLATFQAPIILMSQNRESQRDRITAKYDHAVNRKAEREIENIQADLDEIKALIIEHCKK